MANTRPSGVSTRASSARYLDLRREHVREDTRQHHECERLVRERKPILCRSRGSPGVVDTVSNVRMLETKIWETAVRQPAPIYRLFDDFQTVVCAGRQDRGERSGHAPGPGADVENAIVPTQPAKADEELQINVADRGEIGQTDVVEMRRRNEPVRAQRMGRGDRPQ